jgi:hypothetical protein
MNATLEKLAEFIVGRRDLPTVCARTAFGVIFPAFILGYGLKCVFTRHATIIGRGHLEEIIGIPALAAGIAYSLAGIAVYIYICWDDHPRFAGLREAVLQFLLIAIALLFAATIGLALI